MYSTGTETSRTSLLFPRPPSAPWAPVAAVFRPVWQGLLRFYSLPLDIRDMETLVCTLNLTLPSENDVYSFSCPLLKIFFQ